MASPALECVTIRRDRFYCAKLSTEAINAVDESGAPYKWPIVAWPGVELEPFTINVFGPSVSGQRSELLPLASIQVRFELSGFYSSRPVWTGVNLWPGLTNESARPLNRHGGNCSPRGNRFRMRASPSRSSLRAFPSFPSPLHRLSLSIFLSLASPLHRSLSWPRGRISPRIVPAVKSSVQRGDRSGWSDRRTDWWLQQIARLFACSVSLRRTLYYIWFVARSTIFILREPQNTAPFRSTRLPENLSPQRINHTGWSKAIPSKCSAGLLIVIEAEHVCIAPLKSLIGSL